MERSLHRCSGRCGCCCNDSTSRSLLTHAVLDSIYGFLDLELIENLLPHGCFRPRAVRRRFYASQDVLRFICRPKNAWVPVGFEAYPAPN